jgi:hypothetical protein
MRKKRIDSVAKCLYFQAYEAEFGGKDRGKFQVSREGLKSLLGVQRLHASTIERLTDACLATGLVLIDMDNSFAFAEMAFVERWRKLPVSRLKTYTEEIESLDEEGEDDDWDDPS